MTPADSKTKLGLSETPGTSTGPWGTCYHLQIPAAEVAKQCNSTAEVWMSARNLSASKTFPLHCRGSYRVLLRPWHPKWHHMRRMLRHCGTHPPPLQLSRTLHARHSAIRLPWLPLASDNSCTHRLHGDTTALLKILTNTHTHIHTLKKRGILYVATSCAVIPGHYVPAQVAEHTW